jgi:imidazolonepropionase
LREKKHVRFVDIFCDPRGFTPESARPYIEAAAKLGLPLKVHADQHGRSGGAQLAVESQAVSADGLNEISDTDIEALARSNVVCTLLPGEVYHGLVASMPRARALIDAGAAVALASGFDPSGWSVFNMQAVISLACTQLGMTVEEALVAATVNGAWAVRAGSRCGSLEYNRAGDIVIFNVPDYREIPLYFGSNLVAAVLRKGEVVYREGALSCAGA